MLKKLIISIVGIFSLMVLSLYVLNPTLLFSDLLTNDAPDVRAFYEQNGFISCDNGDLVSFAKAD